MCRGWALGTKSFKKAVLKDNAESIDQWSGSEFGEARELYWENVLETLLEKLGKSSEDIELDKKSASWKVMIAYYLKTHTAVTNGWLSEKLNMGAVQGVSRYISEFTKSECHLKSEYRKVTLHITV
jgi:hypothetical protein